MRHLGPRVATLVDGRMAPDEEERAWSHVHTCPSCSEAVQREGWVKARLAGLSYAGAEPLPVELRGTLHDPSSLATYPGADELDLVDPDDRESHDPMVRPRRLAGLAVLGAGSLSAAMMGVVALGAAPAGSPTLDREGPLTAITHSPLSAADMTGSKHGLRDGNRSGGRDLRSVDEAAVARQVAEAVGRGMRIGL